MDLVKVYIIQSITAASNNLRLNAQQIEVVGLLRETIRKSCDLGEDITRMKKTTAFSKLAIRLNEIYNYLTQGKVDFLKISEQFREHSSFLIRDLNQFLENVSPQLYNESIVRMNGGIEATNTKLENGIDVDLAKREYNSVEFIKEISLERPGDITESPIVKEEAVLSFSPGQFKDFEEQILQQITPVDNLLKRMLNENIDYEELGKFSEILNHYGEESEQKGLTLISDMHKMISISFNRIKSESLAVNKYVIDSLRACLIVIAALVKEKDVNITGYLNRAEEYGTKVLRINNRVMNK